MKRGTSGINALIALDKPTGMTSHDCVARVRKCVGEKRVGHAGTLDPDASGVLVIGIGQGARLMGQLTAERKGYIARISFGTQTTTDDAEGEVVRSSPLAPELYDESFACQALSKLIGPSMQVPPAYSAISVNGERAYARVRKGEDVKLDPRPIEIFSAELVAIMPQPADADSSQAASPGAESAGTANPEQLSWLVSFDVSKGTYIRSIARDLGQSLGSAAHLSGLKRTFSGNIALADCVSLDTLAELGSRIVQERALDPTQALALPVLNLNAQQMKDAVCGKRLAFDETLLSEPLVSVKGAKVSLVFENNLVGIWERVGSELVCDTNFPAGIMGVRR